MQRFSSESGGNAVIDAMIETDARLFKTAADKWPVFLILTTDSGADTRRDPPIERYNRFLDEFSSRGGTAHAIIIQGTRTGLISDIVTNLVANTNGGLETMNISNVLPDKMTSLAERIESDRIAMTGKYELHYTSEVQAAQGAKLELGVERDGVVLRLSPRRPF
jgi:hypothetical protein